MIRDRVILAVAAVLLAATPSRGANPFVFTLGGGGPGSATECIDGVFSAEIRCDRSLGPWVSQNALPARIWGHVAVFTTGGGVSQIFVLGQADPGVVAAGGGTPATQCAPSADFAAQYLGNGSIGGWVSVNNPLPGGHFQGAAATDGSYIYVAGGDVTGTATVHSAQVTGLASLSAWTSLPNLPAGAPFSDVGLVWASGHLLYFGDRGGCSGSVFAAPASAGVVGSWVQTTGMPIGMEGQNSHWDTINTTNVFCFTRGACGTAGGVASVLSAPYNSGTGLITSAWTVQASLPGPGDLEAGFAAMTSDCAVYGCGLSAGVFRNNVYTAAVGGGVIAGWAAQGPHPIPLFHAGCVIAGFSLSSCTPTRTRSFTITLTATVTATQTVTPVPTCPPIPTPTAPTSGLNTTLITDSGQNRILIVSHAPGLNFGGNVVDIVSNLIYQTNPCLFSQVGAMALLNPTDAEALDDGRILITDNGNQRYLIVERIGPPFSPWTIVWEGRTFGFAGRASSNYWTVGVPLDAHQVCNHRPFHTSGSVGCGAVSASTFNIVIADYKGLTGCATTVPPDNLACPLVNVGLGAEVMIPAYYGTGVYCSGGDIVWGVGLDFIRDAFVIDPNHGGASGNPNPSMLLARDGVGAEEWQAPFGAGGYSASGPGILLIGASLPSAFQWSTANPPPACSSFNGSYGASLDVHRAVDVPGGSTNDRITLLTNSENNTVYAFAHGNVPFGQASSFVAWQYGDPTFASGVSPGLLDFPTDAVSLNLGVIIPIPGTRVLISEAGNSPPSGHRCFEVDATNPPYPGIGCSGLFGYGTQLPGATWWQFGWCGPSCDLGCVAPSLCAAISCSVPGTLLCHPADAKRWH